MAIGVTLRRLIALAALPLANAHCSGETHVTGGGELASHPDAAANAGAVSVTFIAPEDGSPIQFSQVTYSITGPTVISGNVAVSHSMLDVVIGGLVPGADYGIGLEATSTDGSVRCSGSAAFTVTARETTSIAVPENCVSTGASNHPPAADGGPAPACCAPPGCAAWQKFQIQPPVVPIGAAAEVLFSVEGASPSDLAFVATTDGGVTDLSSSGGPVMSPGLGVIQAVCKTVGLATIQLVFSDGADAAGCPSAFSTISGTVKCVADVDGGNDAGDADGSSDTGDADGGPNDAAPATDGA
jgi:hypothetical protein